MKNIAYYQCECGTVHHHPPASSEFTAVGEIPMVTWHCSGCELPISVDAEFIEPEEVLAMLHNAVERSSAHFLRVLNQRTAA